MDGPKVTVIIPCRNEERNIRRCISSILEGDFDRGSMEVLLVDGMSTDGTREVVRGITAQYPCVRLLDNPAGIVPHAMNIGIKEARGNYIVRIDAHSYYAQDYITRCVELLDRTGAANVGGPMRPLGRGLLGGAVALAYKSPFGMGGGRFHDPSYAGDVDTVYLGAFRKDIFDRVGCFDEELVRNQDDELNYRIVKSGERIIMSPEIKSWYYPRSSVGALWRQYFQYGYFKARVIRKHRLPASPRHLVPGAFVLSLAALGALGMVYRPMWWLLMAVVLLYAILAGLFSLALMDGRNTEQALLVPAVFAVLHLAYGTGFIKGVVDFVMPGRRYRQREFAQEG